MYHVKINGSYTFSKKVSKIERRKLANLARIHNVIKLTISKKKMTMCFHKEPSRLIDFVKDIVEYLSPTPNQRYKNKRWEKRYYGEIIPEEIPEGITGCIHWEHPSNPNLKEYIYVSNSWYVYLKIERVPRLIRTRETIAGVANAFVDGRTVTVFTKRPQDYVADQILRSVDGEQHRTNRLLFQMIRDVYPPGVDEIVFDYAMDLDFGGLIKELK